MDWEALDEDRPTLGQHRHAGFPEHWDANGRVIPQHPFAKPSTDVQSFAVANIGGDSAILCEVVYRAEGWVPRFTVQAPDVPTSGDYRRQSFGQAYVTLTGLGIDGLTADTLLSHVQGLATR